MKLDVKHQPLNFDIYINHNVIIPRTSLEDEPYTFHTELDAIEQVNRILQRTVSEGNHVNKNSQSVPQDLDSDVNNKNLNVNGAFVLPETLSLSMDTIDKQVQPPPVPPHRTDICSSIYTQPPPPIPLHTNSISMTMPSCPTEIPLMPIKMTTTNITVCNRSDQNSIQDSLNKSENVGNQQSTIAVNHVNPRDFEDTHYNPFDHLQLQTIDERRELGLVFQALHAESSSEESSVHRNHL